MTKRKAEDHGELINKPAKSKIRLTEEIVIELMEERQWLSAKTIVDLEVMGDEQIAYIWDFIVENEMLETNNNNALQDKPAEDSSKHNEQIITSLLAQFSLDQETGQLIVNELGTGATQQPDDCTVHISLLDPEIDQLIVNELGTGATQQPDDDYTLHTQF